MKIVYFHRNKKAGYSINKVTQTLISYISDKNEYYVPYNTATIKSIVKNIIFVYKHRDRSCINHITGDIHYCILGLIGCKSVLTVHDTVMIDYNTKSFFKRKIMEFVWLRIPLLFATKIVCISDATRKSIQRFTKRKDIIVVHNAVSPEFHMAVMNHPTDRPNILILGVKANKNVERTLKALAGIHCHVTIIGKLSQNIINLLNELKIEYSNKLNLTDEEITVEYAKSDIVSFISLFEGFGMPIIEANKVGRPVICSNIEVLKEVAGDSALFVDPINIAEIRNAFVKLISDRNLQQALVEKGFKNAGRFNPDEQSMLLKNVYDSI